MAAFTRTITEALVFSTNAPPEVNLMLFPDNHENVVWDDGLPIAGVTTDVATQPDTGFTTVDDIIDATNGGNSVSQQKIDPVDGVADRYEAEYWVEKQTPFVTNVLVGLLFNGGTGNFFTRYLLNPDTGAFVREPISIDAVSIVVTDEGTMWKVVIVQDNTDHTNITNYQYPAWNDDPTLVVKNADGSLLNTVQFGRTSLFNRTAQAALVFAQLGAVATITEALALTERQVRGAKTPAGVEYDVAGDGADNEHVESRRYKQDANGKTLERIFTIKGTDDPVDAQDVGPQLGQAFDEAGNFVVATREFEVLSVQEGGLGGSLRLLVGYGEASLTPSGLGGRTITFEGAAESRHITRAFTQLNFPAAKDNVGVLIGPINKDKEFEGVDIEEPVLAQNEVHFRSSFPTAERRIIVGLLQKLNDSSFRGFAEGEVRFTRFSASLQSNGQWQLNFGFAINPGRQFVVDISSDAKPPVVSQAQVTQEGWQYFWDETADIEDNGERKSVIKAVHLADVYQKGDYEDLGIGTGPIE